MISKEQMQMENSGTRAYWQLENCMENKHTEDVSKLMTVTLGGCPVTGSCRKFPGIRYRCHLGFGEPGNTGCSESGGKCGT